MTPRGNDAGAFVLSLLLHAAVALVAWLSSLWIWNPPQPPAAGEPIGATLELSSADVRRAEKAIEAARKANPEPAAPTPQPDPSPRPQDAVTPLQPTPQAPLDKPDTVDQEQVVRNAIDAAEDAREQEERRRQEQVDLTEDIVRQQQAEEKQRLLAQQMHELEEIRRARADAAKATRMEEQRLAQLADRALPTPKPTTPRPAQPALGDLGVDPGLLARYKAAMKATAHSNWNRSQAPERLPCKVKFRQLPGGNVHRVFFIDCPYDAQARDSVERALMKSPMPYDEFKDVFSPIVDLTFCYPDEACQP